MNKTFTLALGALMALSTYSALSLAADDAGQPGYYGRIDVTDGPRPKLIYAKPVMIKGKRVTQAPVYLHVRPGHARNWKNHCAEYEACGKRVYFVNHRWYETVYVDHHRQRHSKERNEGKYDHDHDSHHGRNERGEAYGNNGRGNDNGRGQGNGKYED